jgi:hypothetical protein
MQLTMKIVCYFFLSYTGYLIDDRYKVRRLKCDEGAAVKKLKLLDDVFRI